MAIIQISNRGVFSLRAYLKALKIAKYRNARLLAALSNVQNWSLTNSAQQAEHRQGPAIFGHLRPRKKFFQIRKKNLDY